MPALSGTIENKMRLAAASGVIALCFVLELVLPFSLGQNVFLLPLFLMALYYWSIYRPTLVPAWYMFVAGLFYDFLGGMPVGLHAALFVIVQWLVSSQRLYLLGQSFLMCWICFGLVVVGYFSLEWGVFALLQERFPPLLPVAVNVGLAFVFYPIMIALMHQVHKILPYAAGVKKMSLKS